MTDDKTRQLENRIDKLESTIEKMMPSRRDALKMGGAALVGGAAMSGTASAGTNQVGTIGSQSSPVDLESEDINNADTVTTDTLDSTTVDNSGTVTTQDIVVNGTATGPFAGGVALEPGDDIIVARIVQSFTNQTLLTLYNGTSRDVLGGIVAAGGVDFIYTFDDNTTVQKSDGAGSYDDRTDGDPTTNPAHDRGGDRQEHDFLPAATNVTKIEVGGSLFGGASLGAEVILKG